MHVQNVLADACMDVCTYTHADSNLKNNVFGPREGQMHKKFVKIGRIVLEICSWTDRDAAHAHDNIPLPYWGRSN